MNSITEITDRIYATELKQYMYDGQSLSYPIPGKHGEKVVDRFFLYAADHTMTLIDGPYLVFELERDKAAVAGTDSSVFQKGRMPRKNRFVQSPTPENVAEFEKVCMQVREFAFASSIAAEQKILLEEFVKLLYLVSGNGLMELYYEVDRDFFDWIDSLGIDK